jgi:GH25 family lysozyme M1 (1,4-beta-N-acetylmuramidase)
LIAVGGRRLTILALAAGMLVALILGTGANPERATGAPASQSRLPGVDVSRFQGSINWRAVADSGIRFAFLQASRGSGDDCSVAADRCGPDEFYDINYARAKAAGIRVGPYHRAFVGGNGPAGVRANAKFEAKVFIDEVGALRGRDLRPALDVETPFASLSATELRNWVRTWLKRVRRALHAKPIIYTNASSWSALGNPRSFALKGHALWVANWNVRSPAVPADNWAGRGWRIWQHSSTGHVRGIDGNVDLDWLRGKWRKVSIRRAGGSNAGGLSAAPAA